jgi:hypothetical protein
LEEAASDPLRVRLLLIFSVATRSLFENEVLDHSLGLTLEGDDHSDSDDAQSLGLSDKDYDLSVYEAVHAHN